MWHVELAKLSAQLRVRVVVAGCLLAPVLFVLAEAVQSAVPADTIFGRWVHQSGFAVSLVILGFAGQWALPAAIGVVAGDISSEEHRLRTWSLLLTRSRSRSQILIGKSLGVATYTIGITVLLALSSTVAGLVGVGDQPLVGLSGTVLPPGAALQATVGSWASEVAPALAITSIAVLVSVLSRNSWVGVIGPLLLVLALNLVSMLSLVDPIRPFLPTTGIEAWHGLVRGDPYTDQIRTSVLVSLAWMIGCLGLASAVFSRRDLVDA